MKQSLQISDNNISKEFENVTTYDVPLWKIWRHKRFILAILAFFGFMNVYALRSNLSIAIVDMTTLKNITLENGTAVLAKEFEWDSTIQGYVLSSFFYGYIFTQIPGGYLASKLGGSKLFGFGIAVTSVFTLVTPWVVKTNVYFFIAVRIIEGAFEGITFPAMQEVWSHWAPPPEKSRLVSIAISGSYFGAVVSMPICSLLASAFGWETIFYVFGSLGLVWYAMWLTIARDRPSKDSRIDEEELLYITTSINVVKSDAKAEVPWCKLMTSTAVLANTICLTCEQWGFYTMLTYLPQMMKSLLGYDLNKAGFLSAAPYLVMSVSVQASGQLADFLLVRGFFTTTTVRKLFLNFGFVGQAIFILIAGYWVSPVGTPICIIIASGIGGFALSTLAVNSLDVAPKFASIIFAINNTVATIPGIVSPILTGYIVSDSTSVSQWRTIFFISSGIYCFGIIISVLFTSGVIQPWAKTDENSTENKSNTVDKLKQ